DCGGDAGRARSDAGAAVAVAQVRRDQAVGGQLGGVGLPPHEDLPERFDAALVPPSVRARRGPPARVPGTGQGAVARGEDGGSGRVEVIDVRQYVQGAPRFLLRRIRAGSHAVVEARLVGTRIGIEARRRGKVEARVIRVDGHVAIARV